MQFVLDDQEEAVEYDDEHVHPDQVADHISPLFAADFQDWAEGAEGFANVDAADDEILDAEACELDAVKDCGWAGKGGVILAKTEEEGCHRNVEDQSVADNHPQDPAQLFDIRYAEM